MSTPVQRTGHIQIAPEVERAPPRSRVSEFFHNCLCCTRSDAVQDQTARRQTLATQHAERLPSYRTYTMEPLDQGREPGNLTDSEPEDDTIQ